ncbi:MAG: heme-binding protein [Bdellovibrionales bacterium]|nr:heme-binding protein [Bdellovibrionales bacterium]
MKLLAFLLIPFTTTACSIFGARTVEEPKYEVILKEKNFEVRKYNRMIIAKTYVEGKYENTSNKAFRIIADYIFGNNIAEKEIAMTAPVMQEPSSEKIAMTAPVVQSPSEKGWYMYFIMPSKYKMENLPKPNNKDVIVEEVSEQTVAVYTYSGFTTQDKLDKYGKELTLWLQEKGYTPVSSIRSARYNHPLTLPFLRTNEVHISVKKHYP